MQLKEINSLKTLRKSKGYKRKDIAKSMGITKDKVKKIENDYGKATWKELVAFSQAIGAKSVSMNIISKNNKKTEIKWQHTLYKKTRT